MTNKRAAEIMKAIIFILKNDDYSDEVEEAIHMAINALTIQTTLKEKCLTCEHCARCDSELSNDSPKVDRDYGDLISRQEAIDSICREGTRLERNGTVAMVEIKQWCVDLLEELPSAQPQHDISTANFLCPICGAEMEVAVSEWEGENE